METIAFAKGVSDLDWDFESKKILVVGENKGLQVRVLTWDTGNNVGEMPGHIKRVSACAFKPNRPFRCITGGEDGQTIFFAGPPFKPDHSNKGVHTNFVNQVIYSSDGSNILSVSTDKKIQKYDGKTGLPTTSICNAHAGGIYGVAFKPDGTKFATCSADKTVKIWDTEAMTCDATISIIKDPLLRHAQVSISWTPTTGLISLSLDGTLNVLDPAAPEGPIRSIISHQVGITSMYFEVNSKNIYTGSYEGVVCSRNLENLSETCRFKGADKNSVAGAVHTSMVTGLITCNNELLSTGWDDKLRFADITTQIYNSEVQLNGQPREMVKSTSELIIIATNKAIELFRGHDKVSIYF